MGTFSVKVSLSNPEHREKRLGVDLVVDTGAPWTMLPEEVVAQLGLSPTLRRAVTLANGQRVIYPAGEVAIQVDGEQLATIFLAGPAGCLALLGAVTLEQFGLSPDPVRQTLVPVGGLLA